MKRFLLIILSVTLLCLTGCQRTDGPSQDVESQPDNPAPNEAADGGITEKDLESIPILYCEFTDKTISFGKWILSMNELVISEDAAIGTSEGSYMLYSLRWDGDKTISGLQVYLDELNHFDTTVVLQPKNYGEVVKDGTSVSVSDDGGLELSFEGGGRHSLPGSDVTIEGIGKVFPAMMAGNAFSIDDGIVYYLQSIMAEDGAYLVCSAIDLSSMTVESYVVDSKPYPYDEIGMSTFGKDAFAEENGMIYFYTKAVVYAFDPKDRKVSQIFTLEDLPADSSNARFQFSGVNVYNEHIIVECAKYIADIPDRKTSILCSTDGEVLQMLEWDCSEELIILPKY